MTVLSKGWGMFLKHRFYQKLSLFIGAAGYVFFSLILPEFHPFSKSEMYNSFPDKAEVVAITDSLQNVLALTRYFDYNTGDLTHNYHAVQALHANDSLDFKMGKILWQQLKQYQLKPLPEQYKQLRLITLSYNNGQLNSSSKILYEMEP